MNAGFAILVALAAQPLDLGDPFLNCDLWSNYVSMGNCRFTGAIQTRQNGPVARRHVLLAAAYYENCMNSPTLDRGRSRSFVVNRARAHFLAGHLAQSILAFREGLELYPWDAELQSGLAIARAAVAYPVDAEPVARVKPDPPAAWRNRVSPFDLLLVSIVASLLLTVGLARRFTTGDRWATPCAALGLLGVLVVLGVWWQCEREERHARENPTVVIAVDTVLRTGNGPSYPPRVEVALPRGAEVYERSRRGGWVQVELAGGAVGWVPETVVLKSNP